MELARPLDPPPPAPTSGLTALRLQRKLTVEEAAKRAALWPDQVEWLEEGRLYRFPSSNAAVLALLRYTTSLGIDHREARSLSGLPVEPPPRRPFSTATATSTTRGSWPTGSARSATASGTSRRPAASTISGRSSTSSRVAWSSRSVWPRNSAAARSARSPAAAMPAAWS